MQTPKKQYALREATIRLAELLGVAPSEIRQRQDRRAPAADVVVEIAGNTFIVEYKSSGSTAPVSAAIERVRQFASSVGSGAVPLVVVPFMGQVGRRRCDDAGVAWLDLSGNARIVGPGIHVLVEGHANQFKSRGRPSSAFAPKSSRISRWLLMHANDPVKQRDLALATDMDEGFTSRIVSRLEEASFVLREQKGEINLRDPDLLLDAWREVYDFSMHQVLRGHLAARSGDEAMRLLAAGLHAEGVRYAATGLAAAWLLTKFSGFRLTTMYVEEPLASGVLESLGIREEERGANVWIVVPKDEGVFQGAGEHDGIACVHPVQAYLDLEGHPERANEAAEQLRSELLNWSSDA